MKEKVKLLLKSPWFPFAVLVAALVLVHLNMSCDFGDDAALRTQYAQQGLWDVLLDRFYHWSSPGMDTVLMYYLVQLPTYVFKLCNILVMLLAAWSLSRLAGDRKSAAVNWMIVIFILLYPLQQMATAGWIVTSVAYMFPLAFGLYSLVPIRQTLVKGRVPYGSALLALLVGIGSQQMAAILAGFFVLFTVYFILHKLPYKYCAAQGLVAIASVIYQISAPGNQVRYLASIAYWSPNFETVSALNKIKLCYLDTMYSFVTAHNLFSVIFCALLALGVWCGYKKTLYRIIAMIPLGSVLVFGLFKDTFTPMFPNLFALMTDHITEYAQVTDQTFSNWNHYISIALYAGIIACILWAIFLIFRENTRKALLVDTVFLAGFASRMIMSFSPTLYASSTRTFIFMYFAMILCGLFIFRKIEENMGRSRRSLLLGCFGVAAFINGVELVLFQSGC